MKPAAAVALIAALSLSYPAFAAQRQAVAKESPAPATPPPVPPAVTSGQNAQEIREQLERILEQYPPSLPRVLRLDPSLLENATYLQPYPAVAAFVAQHPEVAHNPDYFLSNYERGVVIRQDPRDRVFNMWRDVTQGLFVTLIFAAVAGSLAWLVNRVIDHRRWNRLSRIQAEVHNKLLDRFTANDDLLAYMQTPAGRRFFESGPMPVESPRALGAPLGRILWSAQAAAVLALGGIGLQVVAARATEDIGEPLAGIGVVILAVGLGFAISAVLAYILSRRLGLIGREALAPEPRG